MNKRIKDLAATAASPAGDDFLALDGSANGTRKINANIIGASNDLPIPLPTFVSGATYGTQSITGNIPNNWKESTDITQLYIGNSATSIGDYAFSGCSNITGNLVFPSSITSIGSKAFEYCFSLTGDLTIPVTVTSIGMYAFQQMTGNDLTVNCVTVPAYAFASIAFSGDLIIGNSVTSIGSEAFFQCSGFGGTLTIGNSVTSIGSYAFFDCSGFDGTLTIGNSVTFIGNSAFFNCSGFTGNLIIPNSVTSIGYLTFANCSGLTAAYLNQPIGSIGSYAFSNTGITNVYIGPNATGYTPGSGQNVGGVTVTVSGWTNYPNVP